MKGAAVLTERQAPQVIRAAGYKVVSFEIGEPPKRTALLFRVSNFDPSRRATIEDGLRADLGDAEKVAVDSLGRATVVSRGNAAVAQDALAASLKQRGIATLDIQARIWPRLGATYVVAVSGMKGAAETRAVSDALAGVAKVLAVHVYQDVGTATLWVEEPCDALEANVKAALAAAGFSCSRFELESD